MNEDVVDNLVRKEEKNLMKDIKKKEKKGFGKYNESKDDLEKLKKLAKKYGKDFA